MEYVRLEQSKACNQCKQVKQVIDFYKDKSNKTGYRTRCKMCDIAHLQTLPRNRKQLNINNKRWADANKAKVKQKNANWKKANPEKVMNSIHKRRAAKLANGTFLILPKELKRFYGTQNCFYCGKKSKITMDHAVPLNKGGTHSIGNLIASCLSCNTAKGGKFIMEYKIYRKNFNAQHIADGLPDTTGKSDRSKRGA